MRRQTSDTRHAKTVRNRSINVSIYTDGACDPNPGPGGWGAILISDGIRKEMSGSVANTTNNRMELRAVIEALRALKHPCKVTVWSDSEYLCQGITQWLSKWKASGWLTSGKRPVANQDLWRELEDAMHAHEIDWHWVKGHAGHPMNERADKLARSGIVSLALPVTDPTAAHVFTGASCNGPHGSGAWAVVVREGDRAQIRSGREFTTTSNRLQVLAVCEGLKAVNSSERVHVYTPSDYVQKGASLWLRDWQIMGWKTKRGHVVKNRDAWQSLANASADLEIMWHLIKSSARPVESTQAWEVASRAAQ